MNDYKVKQMTPEKAIEVIEDVCGQLNLTYEQWQAFDVAIQAAYKEVALEVEPDGSSYYVCPRCGKLVYGAQKRCEKCGQRLKWPEEDAD